MEFIEGYFQKFGDIPGEQREHYARLFMSAGIHHYSDSNFVIDESGLYRFIDIATKEIIPEW